MIRFFLLILMIRPVLALDPPAQSFIAQMVSKHGLDAHYLERLFKQAQLRQDILNKISRPAEKKLHWDQYRQIFLTKRRIQAGVNFWQTHQNALKKAESVYGVPAQLIVAIIGVETFYGRITGKDKVLDALYTLAFYYPKRSDFFKSELEHYLLLTREEGLDPTQPKGSYAGAMGLGQFMPSSYRHFAVDFDGDSHRNIWTDAVDAIGSVAHYFYAHGWQENQPVATRVKGFKKKHRVFLSENLQPHLKLKQLRQAGLIIDPKLNDEQTVSLIELKTNRGSEYWAVFNNFYVISRYNHSKLYSMAVYQLSQKILSRKKQ